MNYQQWPVQYEDTGYGRKHWPFKIKKINFPNTPQQEMSGHCCDSSLSLSLSLSLK
jgi:hypothetical protein